ncbi:MAG: diguanylate cyclase [Candidatus Accumulibacter regalis]|jgi:diguanylate cyclase|uniref:GGDEF domain-containing protein n=1 Tax=Candidatus Accumulibacter sp. ACC005 TaxID=2823331 RepID=UPI0025C145D8|nr:GGDEF domain-containing protein [Candidatus Accumulibacter sp. ACC005]HRE86602.1 diguanylate cyclase [Accumulibacter sp.]
MPTPTNPSEIAREAFRLLASRRLPPSPENYRALYHEIAGTPAGAAAPFPERELKALLSALPKEKPAQERLLKRFEQAFKGKTWDELKRGLGEFFAQLGKEQDLPWSELFGDFLRQWESKQAGLTVARKREAVERVLAGAAGNSELLFTRLQGLVRSWSLNAPMAEEIPLVEGDKAVTATAAPSAKPSTADLAAAAKAQQTSAQAAELSAELSEIFAYTLEVLVPSQLHDEPELVADAKALAHKIRTATSRAAMDGLQASIKRFAFRLEILAEDRVELRAGLLNLLQLLIENVGELVVEDRWLAGQIEIVRDIVAGPLSIRSIGDAENRLKEVIFKQGQLKHSLNEARESLKQMLAGFVDHLAEFADSTSDYHDKIEICADRISNAEDISELEDVLAEVIRETQIIQLNAQRSRDELRNAKQSVEDAEKRIGELQAELDKASTLVRHDQLTGVLNRRGLEEAFEKETARAQRRQSTLCVALLDIDNFKKLNDSLGHDAGDAALIHLTTVIRETMRPQDTVARFGGEEFIILLPDTPLEDAQTALVRLQRELTRRIFLHNNNRQLITFSAGLTDLRAGDTQASVSKRADEAMFAAKQAGKNRVLLG